MQRLASMLGRLSLATLMSAVGLACGLTTVQRQAALSLGQAAVTVGSFAATTFPEMRQTAIEMNTTDVTIGGHASRADLDEGFHVEHIASRVAAAHALEAYGELLRTLVEETQKDELRKASSRFVASARSVPGRRLADAQYEALGALVEGIGGMVVEARKARALERIVPAYKADVDHLCALLLEDFDPRGLHLAQRFEGALQRLDSDAELVLAARGGGPGGPALAVGGMRQVTDGRALLEVLGGRGRETVRALGKANTALDAALRDETFSLDDVRAVATRVESLAAAVRALAGS